jgi:hypothetical protein
MLRPVDNYYAQLEEPFKSTLQSLRTIVLAFDKQVHEKWQYGMPFFYWGNKRLCYCWVHKKLGQPYLGIVDGNKIEHPALLQEKRARMKILLIDPAKDIPVKTIKAILKKAITV